MRPGAYEDITKERELAARRLAQRIGMLGGDPTKPDPFEELTKARAESKRKRGLYPPKPKPDRTFSVFAWLFLAWSIYLLIASIRYRFNHPDLTETELFLALTEAFLWQ